MDSTLIEIFGKTCAFVFYEPAKNSTFHQWTFPCVSHGSLEDSSFGTAYVVSIGYLVVLAVTIPIGFFNLDDNIWLQVWAAGVRACVGDCVTPHAPLHRRLWASSCSSAAS